MKARNLNQNVIEVINNNETTVFITFEGDGIVSEKEISIARDVIEIIVIPALEAGIKEMFDISLEISLIEFSEKEDVVFSYDNYQFPNGNTLGEILVGLFVTGRRKNEREIKNSPLVPMVISELERFNINLDGKPKYQGIEKFIAEYKIPHKLTVTKAVIKDLLKYMIFQEGTK